VGIVRTFSWTCSLCLRCFQGKTESVVRVAFITPRHLFTFYNSQLSWISKDSRARQCVAWFVWSWICQSLRSRRREWITSLLLNLEFVAMKTAALPETTKTHGLFHVIFGNGWLGFMVGGLLCVGYKGRILERLRKFQLQKWKRTKRTYYWAPTTRSPAARWQRLRFVYPWNGFINHEMTARISFRLRCNELDAVSLDLFVRGVVPPREDKGL